MSDPTNISRDPKFNTTKLQHFMQQEFPRVGLTKSTEFTEHEMYLKIAIPPHCPFYVILKATHLGIRGCYEYKKYTGADEWHLEMQPACMVLMDESEHVLHSVELKNGLMLRMSLNSVLTESGPESAQKPGIDADGVLKVIMEVKEMVRQLLEKHPDAFGA